MELVNGKHTPHPHHLPIWRWTVSVATPAGAGATQSVVMAKNPTHTSIRNPPQMVVQTVPCRMDMWIGKIVTKIPDCRRYTVVAAGVVGPRAQKVAAVALNLERLQSQDNRMRVATRVQRR